MQSDKNEFEINEIKVIKPKIPLKKRINNGIGNYYTTHFDATYDKSMEYHFGLESNQDVRFQFSVNDKFEKEKNSRYNSNKNFKKNSTPIHEQELSVPNNQGSSVSNNQEISYTNSIDRHIINASPNQRRYDVKLSKEQLLKIRYNKNLTNYEKTKMILSNISLDEIDPYNLFENYPQLTIGSLASKYIIFKRINDPKKGGGNNYNYNLIINTLKYIVKIMDNST
tara:strand:- start:1543 stop:2217 length:675 start_codon:yes stop_codon:yes gene_type:complete